MVGDFALPCNTHRMLVLRPFMGRTVRGTTCTSVFYLLEEVKKNIHI